ncbi:hypothetical protein B0H19DRAFT_1073540 [Mycena capillaripes]|nr:hypothetical protein B0H19DRAFT_1073540 [Mycena capillaripes]
MQKSRLRRVRLLRKLSIFSCWGFDDPHGLLQSNHFKKQITALQSDLIDKDLVPLPKRRVSHFSDNDISDLDLIGLSVQHELVGGLSDPSWYYAETRFIDIPPSSGSGLPSSARFGLAAANYLRAHENFTKSGAPSLILFIGKTTKVQSKIVWFKQRQEP